MLIKNHVYVHQIYHIVLANIAWHATYQDIGIHLQEYVKIVNKMLILIHQKNYVWIVHLIDHYGMAINVYHVQLDLILTR